jgi:kynurenine formamidase
VTSVRRVVDLSVPLDDRTPVYPGDPPVRLTPAATVDRDGYNLLAVHMGSQSGTHCDAPYHFDPAGPRIDELDLRLFTGPGVLLDLRGRLDRHAIGVDDLGPLDRTGPGTIVLLHTGRPDPAHPFLGADACRALLDRGVRTIGLDTPNIDVTPDAAHPPDWACHRMVAAAGGVVVENLTNLAAVDFPDPFVSVLPLRLTGADGAPARAVALQLDGPEWTRGGPPGRR